MQYPNTDMPITDEQSLFSIPSKKTVKARKWREIEEIKARQKLAKELHDIDQGFEFSLTDLM